MRCVKVQLCRGSRKEGFMRGGLLRNKGLVGGGLGAFGRVIIVLGWDILF